MTTLLPLTEDQAAIAQAMASPGLVLCGQIMRESFNGDNCATSGRLVLHIGTVPENALPLMRAAIIEAREPKKRGRRKI